MSVHAPPAEAVAGTWPKQSWFLRGPLLSTVMVITAAAALATELCIMLLSDEHPLGYLGVGLSAFGLLIVFRARWAGLVLMVAGGIICVSFATEHIGVWTVTVIALFLFAKQGRFALPAVALTAPALYMALVHREGGQFDAPLALVAATFCVAAAAVGSAVRLQTESWNAARQRSLDLAAAQAVELRQAVTDERLRIARDLHDVVGHELAVVNINVGVAEVSLPAEADSARHALLTAREALQRTLQETQQILDLLRETGQQDHRSELALLEHVPALVARAKAAGAQVEAHLDPDLPELEADVSAAAYRIVQEALTNARKYGVGAARLTLTSSSTRLIIDVENRVAPRSAPGGARAGYGIVGMRERTKAAGGTLEIANEAGTFGIHVELPTKVSTQ